MRHLPTLVSLGTLPEGSRGLHPHSAPLSITGQDQHWERKRSSPEPSRPEHWDLDVVEAEIHWVFIETRQVLRAVWATPCIINMGYPKAVRTPRGTLVP
jgi:hypothetical protein